MSSDPASIGAHVDRTVFRDVIGRFASGVTVITTSLAGRDFGTTASAVTSLSMEPPMLLMCLNRTSETGAAVAEAGWFGINILAQGQTEIAGRFARKGADKFEGVELVRGRRGMPLIAGALAQLECRIAETAIGGTHTVFMGEVHEAAAAEGEPLTYFRGRFGRFEESLQDAAYRQVRELVIVRELAAGAILDVDDLAERLRLEPSHVFFALTKLTTDGLVERRPEGLVVRALDVRDVHQAIDARCAIEVAVVDKVAGSLSEEDVEALRAHARAADDAVTARPPDVDRAVAEGQAFHAHFIGLLDNELLGSFYRRMDLTGIWRRAAPSIGRIRRSRSNDSYLIDLTDACVSGQRDVAREILYRHAEAAKARSREAIEGVGGRV
jgi:4-nitrophenol 2-monooxygenase / 4-nitrocatechol 4-monooxygenase, reductase component